MKGILIAGGNGTRLYPTTFAVNKQLLAVYDKPLVYYPLSTLIEAGADDILVIVRPQDEPLFRQLLGSGRNLGIRIRYTVQDEPRGIAHALVLARPFLDGQGAMVILGDNIFLDPTLPERLREASGMPGGHVVTAWVETPERYGVVDLDAQGRPRYLLEKPDPAPSNWAVTGVYVYDARAAAVAETLFPSARGELEITDLNTWYLDRDELTVHCLEMSETWMDAGTHEAMHAAACRVRSLELAEGRKPGCIEEAAYRAGRIDQQTLKKLADHQSKSAYGHYLTALTRQPLGR